MSPDPLLQYLNFALAFESAVSSGDWKPLGAYLTDDVVSEVEASALGHRVSGRDAVLAAFSGACTNFDLRFDAREPLWLARPALDGDVVHVPFVVHYHRAGLPSLSLRGEEWNHFRDGRIARHAERFENEPEILAYLRLHDGALRPKVEMSQTETRSHTGRKVGISNPST
jgi:SnoaL-like domain